MRSSGWRWTRSLALMATIALLATAFALPYALIQPILGPVGDALGKRRIIVIATILTGLALIACALSPRTRGSARAAMRCSGER